MIGSWRVLLIFTSQFPMYQSIFLSKKLNDKKNNLWALSYCALDINKVLYVAGENTAIPSPQITAKEKGLQTATEIKFDAVVQIKL